MSDTPRTDAFEALPDRPINWWDFARELERENAALREKDADWENAVLHARDHRCDEAHCTCVTPLLGKINQLERENAALKQRILDDNKAYGCELRDPSGTIWDHAKELQIENANLRLAREARNQLPHSKQ